ncbi:MAG: HEAT repeat domain-containing protein [Chloroflexi bacterium]|nr:HEAT repeat domain-containing protein [Chloroflexota bacterium]
MGCAYQRQRSPDRYGGTGASRLDFGSPGRLGTPRRQRRSRPVIAGRAAHLRSHGRADRLTQPAPGADCRRIRRALSQQRRRPARPPECQHLSGARISIVQALGNLRATEAIDRLIQLLTVPDVGITLRLTVVTALGLLGDSRAIPALETLLNSTDEHLNKRVRRSLDTLLHVNDTEEREN